LLAIDGLISSAARGAGYLAERFLTFRLAWVCCAGIGTLLLDNPVLFVDLYRCRFAFHEGTGDLEQLVLRAGFR